MNEVEWLAATNPHSVLTFLRGKATDRKLRLFSCACCRHVPHLMPDRRTYLAPNVAERVADGLADEREWDNAIRMLRGLLPDHAQWPLAPDAFIAAPRRASFTAAAVHSTTKPQRRYGARRAEEATQASLLRCIFGNPLRPVAVDPSWVTSTIVALAEGIYQERAFDRLPILADALLDTGCDNDDILNHCRGPGPHACGCWVVDMVLGKK